jgi:hypothetical protein
MVVKPVLDPTEYNKINQSVQNIIQVYDREAGTCSLLAEIITTMIKLFMLSSFMLFVII